MRQIRIQGLTEKEKGYVLGLFEGDGYLFHDKKSRHYLVDFYLNSNTDRDITEFLSDILKKAGCNPNAYQDKRYKCVRIRVKSRQFMDFVQNRRPIFEKDFILGFVSGFLDADGHVNRKKSFIQIINTNEGLLLQTQKMLSFIGIKSSLRVKTPSAKDKKRSFNLFITFKFMDTDNISRKAKRQVIQLAR